jgi:four helix bundle protein
MLKQSLVADKSYAFALTIVQLARTLRQKHEYELATQLLRSGTSIGANVEEALAGISRPDFIAKMGIASKEARETRYWLRLIHDSKIVPAQDTAQLIKHADELLRMLIAIVKTSQVRQLPQLKTYNSKLITKGRAL